MSHTFEQLHQYVCDLEIFDTHEHLPAYEKSRPMGQDVLTEYLMHYFSCDLLSAGLSDEGMAFVRDSSKPLADRWRTVEPYWEAARNTGYGRSLDIAARDLYGLARIDGKTIAALDEAFRAARAAGGTYEDILKKRSKIRLSVVDAVLEGGKIDCDRRFFRAAARLDDAILVGTMTSPAQIARQAGMSGIHCLTDLEQAVERIVDKAFVAGAACLKCALAYVRTLKFEKVSAAAAEDDFNRMLASDAPAATEWANYRPFWLPKLQDYLMHALCRLADARGLVFQVHTGLQEGNGNHIANADPTLLSNLFVEYPNVKFDLFHIGYPYQQTLSALAKNFRNVFIDFAWAHIVSPTAAVSALVEYLDAVPANKISAFGGDYCFVDGIYGHQVIARQNVARALAIKVEQDAFDLDRAKQIAKMILHDNPSTLFGLGDEPAPADAEEN